MLEITKEHEDKFFMMSDEAYFHLNGSVNKQNFRYWAAQNPHEFHERLLYSPKVTVWCAIGKVGIIGPYFFEENGIPTTVHSARYIDMINNSWNHKYAAEGLIIKMCGFNKIGPSLPLPEPQ
jgi:hypothetical protein